MQVQQQVDSMREHTDVLIAIILLLGAALVGVTGFLFRSIWNKQRALTQDVGANNDAILQIKGDIKKMGADMSAIQIDAGKALKKSEEIEKNYIKRFDGLSSDIHTIKTELIQVFNSELNKVNQAISNIRVEMNEKFMAKGDCERVHEKMEKTLEKMETKINAD